MGQFGLRRTRTVLTTKGPRLLSAARRSGRNRHGSGRIEAGSIRLVSAEMSLHALAYNLKRAMQILGIIPLMMAIAINAIKF
jgi:hypothetical protein